MNLFSLILYGALNLIIVVHYSSVRGKCYEFPFWAAAVSLGWFFPQAIGGYGQRSLFPGDSYAHGMLFATLCTAALWIGFEQINRRPPARASWLDAPFDTKKLYMAGASLCVCGFFFHYKLMSLPAEVLAQTQWSGAAVKYLFLSNVFILGFITLWLLYLSEGKLIIPHLLVFIIPSILLLLQAAVLQGRRAAMMNLVAYIFVSLWFVRRITIPRWLLMTGLFCGLVLINAISTYRDIMQNKDESISQRLSEAYRADYRASTDVLLKDSGKEFSNYVFYRQIYADEGIYDFGLVHWNEFIFSFVPAQLVGRSVKTALMIPVSVDAKNLASSQYGHTFGTGTTLTGYTDAFASFGWFGFVKFWVIGMMMGALYRRAMMGRFLGQMLYVYALAIAMHAITHRTHLLLVSAWVYFFALGYPALFLARMRKSDVLLQEANHAT